MSGGSRSARPLLFPIPPHRLRVAALRQTAGAPPHLFRRHCLRHMLAGDRLQHGELMAQKDLPHAQLDEFSRARLKRALLLLEAAETLAITKLMFGSQVEERDLSGVSDNALYWYFLTGVWIPLYIAVFLSPYFM